MTEHHPAEATTIGELGIDYLIDRTSLDRIQRADELTALRRLDSRGREQRLWSMVRAAALLAESDPWRRRLLNLVDTGQWRSEELSGMVVEREGARPFDADVPLPAQLCLDAQALLDVLAVERQATTSAVGDLGVPLAAPLLARRSLPPRAAVRQGAVEVVEVGDLADPFACLAHRRVYDELRDLHDTVSWRWLYCATPRTLLASHRVGAVAERVAERAPGEFWAVVDTIAADGLDAGVEHARSALAAAGEERILGLPPRDGDPLPAGLLRDRTIATVCGLPELRPLFTVGRAVFAGTDASPRLRAHLEALTTRG